MLLLSNIIRLSLKCICLVNVMYFTSYMPLKSLPPRFLHLPQHVCKNYYIFVNNEIWMLLVQFSIVFRQDMAHKEANSWTRRVASVVKRSCGVSCMLESLFIVEVTELLNTHLPLKSSTSGFSFKFLQCGKGPGIHF